MVDHGEQIAFYLIKKRKRIGYLISIAGLLKIKIKNCTSYPIGMVPAHKLSINKQLRKQ